MPAPNNSVTTAQMNVALDRELIRTYTGDYTRLAEILGITSVETVAAGTALYQTTITGALNDSADADSGTSSGTAYVEGEEVALSQYEANKTPVDVAKVTPYRKLTTADAILKSGYDVAVLRTDQKMLNNLRNAVVARFFGFLATGTGAATGATLQATLANVDAAIGDAMETAGDSVGDVVHFVNRQDAADYLGTAPVTTQTAFGLTYLETFLGIQRVFLTNKVGRGVVYATPTDNVHAFGIDFGALSAGGLAYAQSDSGIIGVAHTPAYDRMSCETHVINGLTLFAEVTNYICKGTFGKADGGNTASVNKAKVGASKVAK